MYTFLDEKVEIQVRHESLFADAETARFVNRWLAGRIRTYWTGITRAIVAARRRLHGMRHGLARPDWIGIENVDLVR